MTDNDAQRLATALESGRTAEVIDILQRKDPLGFRFTSAKGTVLHLAVAYNRKDIIDYLIAQPYGPDLISTPDANGITPFQFAQKRGQEDTIMKMSTKLGQPPSFGMLESSRVRDNPLVAGNKQPYDRSPDLSMAMGLNTSLNSARSASPAPVPLYNVKASTLNSSSGPSLYQPGKIYYEDKLAGYFVSTSNDYFYRKANESSYLPQISSANQLLKVYDKAPGSFYDDGLRAMSFPVTNDYLYPKGSAVINMSPQISPLPSPIIKPQPAGVAAPLPFTPQPKATVYEPPRQMVVINEPTTLPSKTKVPNQSSNLMSRLHAAPSFVADDEPLLNVTIELPYGASHPDEFVKSPALPRHYDFYQNTDDRHQIFSKISTTPKRQDYENSTRYGLENSYLESYSRQEPKSPNYYQNDRNRYYGYQEPVKVSRFLDDLDTRTNRFQGPSDNMNQMPVDQRSYRYRDYH